MVALLCLHGDRWFGDRWLSDIAACSGRRQRGTAAEVLPGKNGEGIPSLRTVGFRRNRYPGPAATAHAHGSVSDSRGHHAIFQEKIPVGADARPDPEVQRFGVLGSLLRTANPGCDGATSTANSICSQRPRH